MKAAVVHQAGGVECLRLMEVPIPPVNEGHVSAGIRFISTRLK